MKHSAADIIREYGPFPGVDQVHGVTYDGQQVWFATGDKLNALDPASGKTLRALDVPGHAGTAFDGQHLFQIAEKRIQKVDPASGRVGRGLTLGGPVPGTQDPSSRSRHRHRATHHRVEPLRHRRDVGRW